jgi:hypothetical protein
MLLSDHRLGFLVQADADIQRSVALLYAASAAAIGDGDCLGIAEDGFNLTEVENSGSTF